MRARANDESYDESVFGDARRKWPSPDVAEKRLTLVTCYPFDAVLPGGPLRFLVFAEAEPD